MLNPCYSYAKRGIFFLGRSPSLIVVVLFAACYCIAGCSIRYYDPVTSTEHSWGFGYTKMKVSLPQEGLQGIYTQATIVGVGIGVGERDRFITIGYDNKTVLTILDQDASLRIEWPDNNLFNVRIGARPPFDLSVEPDIKGRIRSRNALLIN